MEKNVALGQYSPGEGVLRRLDPRTKLYSLLAYVVLVLLSGHPVALGLATAVFIVAWGTSGCSLLKIVRSARGVLFMLIVAELFSLIWVPVETVLITFWKVLLISLMSVTFTKTTEPQDVLDGLRAGFPVGESGAMSIAIAFDFLPQLGREMERMKVAAASRGAVYEEGNPFRRAANLIPLLIPLFRSTLRHAGRLADAMDLRGYNAGTKRTRMEPLEYHRIDRIAGILMLTFAVAVVLVMIFL